MTLSNDIFQKLFVISSLYHAESVVVPFVGRRCSFSIFVSRSFVSCNAVNGTFLMLLILPVLRIYADIRNVAAA